MELIRESVRLARSLGDFVSQVTLEQDLNIPDNKPDVEEIILHKGSVSMEAVRLLEEKGEISGSLKVEILYKCQGEGPAQEYLSAEIPIKDMVQTKGVGAADYIIPKWEVEDLKVKVLNSRKLTISGLVSFSFECGGIDTEDLPLEVEEMAGKELEVDFENRDMEILSLEVRKKDSCRIREDVELGSNKPNISKLLWKELSVSGINCRIEEGKIRVNGDLVLFVLYQGEEEHIPLQWLEKSISFNEELECPQAAFGQIPDISVTVSQADVTVKPDYDGENRVLSLEALLELSIQLFGEKKVSLLKDAYSPVKELLITRKDTAIPRLLMKNNGKCKVTEKLSLPEDAACLQICASSCQVHVDTVTPGEDLLVEGALLVSLIYMSSEDARPIKSFAASVPFSQNLEVKGIHPGVRFSVRPQTEQLSTVMLSGSEVEVRAMIDLDTIVMEDNNENIIKEIDVRPFDEAVINAMPGIIGYIAKEGDSLWSIAKEFYTSIDRLRRYNNLSGDTIKPGDKLLIVKEGQL